MTDATDEAPEGPQEIDLAESAAAVGARLAQFDTTEAFERTVERARDSAALGYSSQEQARDYTRQTISLWLVGLLCAIVVLSFTALFLIGAASGFGDRFFDHLRVLLELLFGPVIALLSSAVGFYFGTKVGEAGTPNAPANALKLPPNPAGKG